MLNKIALMGRLTRNPELRKTPAGVSVCQFTIACDRDFKNEKGEHDTDFIDIVAWRATADFVSSYFVKGRMAIVEGRLQLRDWTDREGGKRRSAEIIASNVYFGDSKPQGEKGAPQQAPQQAPQEPPAYNPNSDFGFPADFQPNWGGFPGQ